MREWDQKAHYETTEGDRVSLLEVDGRWAICWSYGYPNNGTQLVEYGPGQAVNLFTGARERKTLAFDSRQVWQNGSV